MSDMKSRPPTNQETNDSASGWAMSGAFLGSILSGTLLGYLADLWLDTRPWLVVVGILAGSYAGFMTMWRQSKTIDSIERRRP
ncbi:MAG TPA: AtpZ/AtpI family protein [Acidimicrobiia bacterium]|nr:AtpZ/AtpI family protein [Acidimicrobiia bacterium]